MAALQSSAIIQFSSPFSAAAHKLCKKGTTTMSILDLPKSQPRKITLPNLQITRDNLILKSLTSTLLENQANTNISTSKHSSANDESADSLVMAKIYAILEAVADRVEMHKNIGEQRKNWNCLFLSSINAMTLAAATMSGIAAINSAGVASAPVAALKISSSLMFLAATGMLLIINKIQPSQLVEEQRNATRLFQQLHNHIQTVIRTGHPTDKDVKEAMQKVLALDKAYPLPLLGVMLEKFPSKVEPAVWWPQTIRQAIKPESKSNSNSNFNGWNKKLDQEMKSIAEVLRIKDEAEYLRLGGKALKMNKLLAISGPLLTGMAAIGSAFVGSCSYIGFSAAVVGVVGGALASIVNTFEHGGQVGMVFEMYRCNAGFFKQMEESIESNLVERQENGELFEMKVALQLGRSLSELRNLASSSASFKIEDVNEFGSKLF